MEEMKTMAGDDLGQMAELWEGKHDYTTGKVVVVAVERKMEVPEMSPLPNCEGLRMSGEAEEEKQTVYVGASHMSVVEAG